MPKPHRIKNELSRFSRDERGNFAMLTGITILAVSAALTLGIDTSRAFTAKSQLGSALDSAVTAVARDVTTGIIAKEDVPAAMQRYLNVNAERFARNGGIVIDRVDIDTTTRTIEVAAHTILPLAFPIVHRNKSLRVSTLSAAGYSDQAVEVAMMLDITGSMKGQKIEDLKFAARNAVDAFLSKNGPNSSRVRVAIVPYAYSVNVGKGELAKAVHVEEQFSGGNSEPIAYDDYWGKKGVAVAANTKTEPYGSLPTGTKRIDYCATDRKGNHAYTNVPPTTALVARDFRLKEDQCTAAEIQPLTNSKTALTDTIDTFRASGYTAGHIGVQWTWYMLSNSWANFLPASSVPAKSGSRNVMKYAVLMTDGEFNTAYAGNGQKDYNGGGQEPNSSARAKTLCAAMKKEGIEVFTIGFQLKEQTAKNVLKACASPDSQDRKYYYDTSTGAQLNDAFLEVARNIERLALTK
jgi:Flp pilus assembly protein TadG